MEFKLTFAKALLPAAQAFFFVRFAGNSFHPKRLKLISPKAKLISPKAKLISSMAKLISPTAKLVFRNQKI